MQRLKIAISIVLAFTLLTINISAVQYTPDFAISSQAAYIAEMDSGTVIYEKNSDTKVGPASLANIMTAILSLEKISDLDNTEATMTQDIQDELYMSGARLAGILKGETLSVRKLLYAMMLQSGAEASMMIANAVAGSQADFVTMMNAKAAELGATNTHFSNAHGLYTEDSYTTAKDIAIITKYALSLPGFLEIANTVSYEGGPTNKQTNLEWVTTNSLISVGSSNYNRYAKGIKTGYTPESGRFAVTEASKDGINYLIVLMNASANDETGALSEENYSFKDTNNIINWLFSSFKVKTLLEKGKNITEVPLRLVWDQDHLTLMSADRFTALLPADIETTNVQMVCRLPESVSAPVNKGDKVGTVQLVLNGDVLGEVDLVAAQTVQANGILKQVDKLRMLTNTLAFKFAVVLIVLIVVLYIVFMILKNRRKPKYKTKYRNR